MALTRSFRISDAQQHKLNRLAETLGISPNATVGQLIDNAEIQTQTVEKLRAVTKLPGKNNSRSAQVLAGQSATAVNV